MKISPVVKRETARIAAGVFALSAVMVVVFALLGHFDLTVVWGALLGSCYAVLNFFLMAYTIQKGTETTHEQAKAKVQVSYMMRNLLMLVVGIVGVALPHFHWLAVLLPFVFPRIVIYLMQIFKIVDVNEPVSDVQNEPEGRENEIE